MSTHIFGEVGENRTLVNGFADHLLTTRTLPQIFDWILITFIDYMPPARNNAAPAVQNRWERFAVVFTLTLASSSKRALASTMRTRESSTHHHTIIMELYCEPTHLNELSLILFYSITLYHSCQRLSMPAHLRYSAAAPAQFLCAISSWHPYRASQILSLPHLRHLSLC